MIAMLDPIMRNLKLVSTPLLLLLAVACWSITPWGINVEEHLGLDELFKWRGHLTPPKNIVIIAISPRSADALGLPKKLTEWPRSIHGQTVNTLKHLGAKMIAFDVFFQQARNTESDQSFAQALKDAGNVLLFANSRRDMVDYGDSRPATIDDIEEPLQLFKQAAANTAPMLLPKVPARVSRFVIRHPSDPNRFTIPAELWLSQQSDHDAALKQLKTFSTQIILNLYGPARTITTIDLQTLLQQPNTVAEKIKDAVVFVGYSARFQPEEQDGYYTVYTNEDGLDVAGVELGATAYTNLRDHSFLRELPAWMWALIVWSYGTSSFLIARLLSPTASAVGLALLATLLSVTAVQFLSKFYLWLPWFIPVALLTPGAGAFGMWQRSRELSAQRDRLQHAFGKYLPPAEIKRLAYDSNLPANQEYLYGLCLVTDAEGYTALSERLSPDTLALAMEKYYAAIIGPIRAAQGLISDVTGDGVIAIWPHVEPENAWQTIAPVIYAIEKSVADYNAKYPEFNLPTRMGFHAGKVVLGHFGALDHYEFKAMGDIVNTTSRLEGANKFLGTRALISESCFDKPNRHDDCRDLGYFKFAGKQDPLQLFTVNSIDPALSEQFASALALFVDDQVNEALEQFQRLSERFPDDGPTRFYLNYLSDKRTQQHRRKGVVVLVQK